MTSHRMRRLTFAAAVVVTLMAGARAGRAADDELISQARQAIADYRRADRSLGPFLKGSVAYAVFPGVGKGGYVVGGAHGTGVLFENGVPTGKVKLNQVSVGAQIGGQEFSQVIFFQTPSTVADFKQGKLKLSAEASAVALNEGAAAVARFQNGVAIFTHVKGGAMAEASVGGQKFTFEPF
jgi:lipid-binding SYLF domain-containing protein